MTELERHLVALADEIDWPETPRVEASPLEAAAPGRRLPSLALGLAVLVALVAGVLALSPGARSAFLELFGIRGATVERVERLPELDARRLDLGQRMGRAEAERRVGFLLLDLGSPDGIYVRGRAVSVVYGPLSSPRLVLTQLRGGIWEGLVQKIGSAGTTVEEVTVDGEPGLFVSGDEHFVAFLDESGAVVGEETFLAGTVLLWNRGRLLLRLEGDLARDEAIELAESVR